MQYDRYAYQQPVQQYIQYQPMQVPYQPAVRYLQYQQPAQVLYQQPVQYQYVKPVQYAQVQQPVQYVRQPVYQKIQYKPVVQQRRPAVQPNYFQYPQQNVKKMTKNEIDEINRTISEGKNAMKKKGLRFAGKSEWLNDVQKIDDKGDIVMTSDPVERKPMDYHMQLYYASLAEQEAFQEQQMANKYETNYLDKLPLSESFILDKNTGIKYKLIARPQPNMAAYYAPAQNMINNVPVQKYVNYNGMYYYK